MTLHPFSDVIIIRVLPKNSPVKIATNCEIFWHMWQRLRG